MSTGRAVVWGTHGVVAAGQHLTAMSGMRMLLAGGNAFDAAVAVGFAGAVLEPLASYSLGAEASFLLYDAASRRIRVLCGQGVAPGRATVDLFRQKGLDKIPTGPGPNVELSFTVPGVADAYFTLLETYGTKTLGEVAAPAIEYARRGFPMYEHMGNRLRSSVEPYSRILEQFGRYPPGGAEVFYPGGKAPQDGQILDQDRMAATLSALVEAESAAATSRVAGIRAARDMFYRGDIARAMVRCSERFGGLLTLEDLAGYHASFDEPISATFMGHEIHTQSVWTQGAVLLQTLNILEHSDLRAMGHNTPRYIHTLAEALKLAFADRERYYGDPDYAQVPVDGLLSKEYAAARAGLIRPDQACSELPEPGDPWRYCDGTPQRAPATVAATTSRDMGVEPEGDTTHFAVIDRDGNMVCVTPSGGFFPKSVYIPELGFSFSTRSEMFFVEDGHPNGLQPGKRPRTTLVNSLVCKDGEPLMTIGCPGADNQTQAGLQILLNMLIFGMDPQQAVEAPRFASWSMINSFYPRVYLPGQLNVEAGIPEEVRSRLMALGHKVVDAETCGNGAIVTRRDPQTGVLCASADPRRATYAMAW